VSTPKQTPFKNGTIIKLASISIAVLISFSILFTLIYQMLIPELIHNQIELRAKSITTLFAGSILEHVAALDYLSINKITENVASLPDVGYACVINNNGNIMAGILGNPNSFDAQLISEVKTNGFPAKIAAQIHLQDRNNDAISSHQIGGRSITDYALRLDNVNSEIHVGILADDNIQMSQTSFIPHIFLLILTTILGIAAFAWVLINAN
jgi:hypothetical protein